MRPANPVADFAEKRQTVLPLPEGEGRGEGKGMLIGWKIYDCWLPFHSAACNNPATGVACVAVTRARWFRESTLYPGADENSKNAKLSLRPFQAMRRELHPFSFVPRIRAGNHPIQCSRTLRHRKNLKCNRQTYVDGEICRQRIAGRAASSTRASPPTYLACASCGRAG
jgi:hypothetical protein